MAKQIAINGLGRIGKTFLRVLMQDAHAQKSIKVAAINFGPAAPANIAHYFKYDSVFGPFDGEVSSTANTLTINGQEIKIFTQADPTKLPWKDLNIDWVVEASGKFTSKEKAMAHINAGAKKVLITAPASNEDATIVLGINEKSFDPKKHAIVSMASCTTNCFAPILKVLKESFGLTQGFMTTVHAYTNNQALLDSDQSDPRRGRAAAINIIPTSTGADSVISKLFPDLKGKLQASALRVPVATVSIVDFTFTSEKPISVDAVNTAFANAAAKELKNILCYTTEPLVSSDFIKSPYSCIFDATLTQAAGNMGKVFGWYDNEFGYSTRLKDFLLHN